MKNFNRMGLAAASHPALPRRRERIARTFLTVSDQGRTRPPPVGAPSGANSTRARKAFSAGAAPTPRERTQSRCTRPITSLQLPSQALHRDRGREPGGLRELDEVLVVREEQYLGPGTQLAENFQGRQGAIVVELDQ